MKRSEAKRNDERKETSEASQHEEDMVVISTRHLKHDQGDFNYKECTRSRRSETTPRRPGVYWKSRNAQHMPYAVMHVNLVILWRSH